jgi:hypothetical protein
MVDGEKVDQTRRAINLSLPQGHGSQATTMPGWRARRGGTLLTIVRSSGGPSSSDVLRVGQRSGDLCFATRHARSHARIASGLFRIQAT